MNTYAPWLLWIACDRPDGGGEVMTPSFFIIFCFSWKGSYYFACRVKDKDIINRFIQLVIPEYIHITFLRTSVLCDGFCFCLPPHLVVRDNLRIYIQ